MPSSAMDRSSTMVESRWAKVLAAGVGEVVGGDETAEGSDGTFLRGGDALLKNPHLLGERGLVADGGGRRPRRADTFEPAWENGRCCPRRGAALPHLVAKVLGRRAEGRPAGLRGSFI